MMGEVRWAPDSDLIGGLYIELSLMSIHVVMLFEPSQCCAVNAFDDRLASQVGHGPKSPMFSDRVYINQ